LLVGRGRMSSWIREDSHESRSIRSSVTGLGNLSAQSGIEFFAHFFRAYRTVWNLLVSHFLNLFICCRF